MPRLPQVSVVVPTFNRQDVIVEVVEAICRQEGAPPFELIVVDDGSTDGTPGALAEFVGRLPKGPESVRTIRQTNQGPAAARNHGVRESRGDLVAFLGDDTVPSKGWLAAHLAARQRPAAQNAAGQGQVVGTIGYTDWHRRMRPNAFLRYINEYGLQFGYSLIEDVDAVPFNFLYTSNLLLPRWALVEHPFDLAFPYPAWEDIELAYRLRKAHGLLLLYEPSARVEHDHPTSLARFCQRQEKAGYCATVFHRLHPEMAAFLGLGETGPPPLPGRARQVALEGLARALQVFGTGWPKLWEDVLRYHYIRGLHRGWREPMDSSGSARR